MKNVARPVNRRTRALGLCARIALIAVAGIHAPDFEDGPLFDDDEVKPVLVMSSTGFIVDEGYADNIENVVVTLSGLTDKDVTFSYSTSDGRAPPRVWRK